MNRHVAAKIAAALLIGTSSLVAQTADTVTSPLGIRLDSALTALAGQGLSGAILVVRDGLVVLRKGYGLANRRTSIPFTVGTVTQIGSNTKDFTAVAILQLAERGRLHLGDSITRFFPSVPADKRAITVHDLLQHTAGLPQYSGGDFQVVTRDQFLATILASPLRSPVGVEEHYSNPGFSLLAAIIENVTGTSYDAYVRDNILRPLGLHETGFLLPRFDPARLAHAYSGGVDDGTILDKPHAPDGPYWNLRGNGGMLSTVNDMSRFYRALFESATLLDRATRDSQFPSDRSLSLAGGDGVSYFLYERHPRLGLEIVIATNSNDVPGRKVEAVIGDIVGIGGGGFRVVAAPVGPEPTLPETPAAAAFALYRDAFNSGDSTAMMRLFAERFAQNPHAPPMAQRLANYQRMFGIVGAFRPIRVEATETNRITVVVVSKNDREVAVTIIVEPEPPHRIVSTRFEPM